VLVAVSEATEPVTDGRVFASRGCPAISALCALSSGTLFVALVRRAVVPGAVGAAGALACASAFGVPRISAHRRSRAEAAAFVACCVSEVVGVAEAVAPSRGAVRAAVLQAHDTANANPQKMFANVRPA
jgi:hypothetical protein